MAIAKVADRGTKVNTAAANTVVVTLTNPTVIAVGSYLILRLVCANSGGGGAARSITSVTDPRSNTWTRVLTQNIDPGAADAGCTTHLLYARVATAYLAGDTITVNLSGNVTKAAGVIEEWSGLESTGQPGADSGTGNTANTTNPAPVTGLTPPLANYLVYVVDGWRGPSTDGYTADTDVLEGSWTALTKLGTGTTTTDWTVCGDYKVVSGTSAQSHQASGGWGANRPAASVGTAAFKAEVVATNANAICATGSGASNNADATVQGTNGVATATVAANDTSHEVKASAECATASGVANDTTITTEGSADADAESASGSGASADPSSKVDVNAETVGGGVGAPPAIAWEIELWAGDPDWSNPGNGNAVSTWPDRSGNANDLTQATGTRQPIFRSSVAALNWQSAIEFDTSDDDMASSTFSLAQPFSVVVVGNITQLSSFADLLFLRSSDAAPYTSYATDGGTPNRFRIYDSPGDLLAGTETVDADPHFFAAVFNGITSKILLDSQTWSGGNLGSDAATQLWLNSNALGGNWGGGHRAYVGLFDGDITADANWTALLEWINSTYGVTTGEQGQSASAVIGTAYDATVETAIETNAQAECATGSGLAGDSGATIASTIGDSAGSGVAQDVTARLQVGAEAGTGTGAAQGTGGRVDVGVQTASATGEALQPTVTTTGETFADAGCATATGQADNAMAGLGTGTGAGAGTGAAQGTNGSVNVGVQDAAASGAALQPSITTTGATNVFPECALGTGSAADSGATVATSISVIAVNGTAPNAQADIGAGAGSGGGTGSGQGTNGTVAVTVGSAEATGAALQPMVSTEGQALAQAGCATAAGSANALTATITSIPEVSPGSGVAPASHVELRTSVDWAGGAGAADGIAGGVFVSPSIALGTGLDWDPASTILSVIAVALALGNAYNARVNPMVDFVIDECGREPAILVTGNEPLTDVRGCEPAIVIVGTEQGG